MATFEVGQFFTLDNEKPHVPSPYGRWGTTTSSLHSNNLTTLGGTASQCPLDFSELTSLGKQRHLTVVKWQGRKKGHLPLLNSGSGWP